MMAVEVEVQKERGLGEDEEGKGREGSGTEQRAISQGPTLNRRLKTLKGGPLLDPGTAP